MRDLVNEGRNLQDNFNNKLVKENPLMNPAIDKPSKLDTHYKINHPVLTLLSIKQSGGESKSMSSSQSMMIMTFGLKSSDVNNLGNSEVLMRDASKIARMICDLLDNYNTDHYPGRPSHRDNTITIPIKVTTWTGD